MPGASNLDYDFEQVSKIAPSQYFSPDLVQTPDIRDVLYNGSDISTANVKIEDKYSESEEYDEEKEKSSLDPDEISIG